MKFVTDEHVPDAVVNALRSSGYDVRRAQDDYGQGGDDPELLENCAEDGRVLLTNDRDFVRLGGEQEHSGIVIYTSQELSPRQILRAIRRIDETHSDEPVNRIMWLQGWLSAELSSLCSL